MVKNLAFLPEEVMANSTLKSTLKSLCISLLVWSQANAQDEFYDQCCQPAPYSTLCDDCECCNRFWGEAEYLYWKMKDSPNPVPLVVTAPIAHNRAPLIGEPGTRVVLGGKHSRNDWRSGGRFALGYWFDEECCFGAEVSYFFLPNGSKSHSVFSSGLPGSIFLSVPYFDTNTQTESSSPVATPGRFRGRATLNIENRLQGAELNGLATLLCNCAYRVNVLAGFRYLNFNERLKLHVNSPAIAIPEEIYLVNDKFHTENNFYGGQIGLGGDYSYCQFFINAKGKVALGAMCEEVIIKGQFITNSFDGFTSPQTFRGGYFGLPSNIGHHKHTRFSVIPEVNVNIGYQLMNCLRIQLGYTFLYVNKLLWAGKQINRNINPTQSSLYEFTATPTLVGRARPKASHRSDSFWAQGLNVGLVYQF